MSNDALDRPMPKQKMNRKARQDYAQRQASEELLVPPLSPLRPEVYDPSLLPKRPPGSR